MHRILLSFALLALAAGCVGRPTLEPVSRDVHFVRHGDMTYRVLETGAASVGALVVVIEGDGAAWSRPDRPPRDPTPRDPVGMRLVAALADAHPVLHLGRPCQFLARADASGCAVRWWTRDRYDDAIVSSYVQTIEAARRGRDVVLVGHSGGGVVAAELALRLDGVTRLVTIAAPLDLAAWTAFHGVSPIASPSGGALLDRLAALPTEQTHLFGARDRVVPDRIARSVRARIGSSRTVVVDGMAHDGRWEAVIPSVVRDERM